VFLLIIFYCFSSSSEADSTSYTIPKSTTTVIYSAFAAINIGGVAILSLLKAPKRLAESRGKERYEMATAVATKDAKNPPEETKASSVEVMRLTLKLATQRRMVLRYFPAICQRGIATEFLERSLSHDHSVYRSAADQR